MMQGLYQINKTTIVNVIFLILELQINLLQTMVGEFSNGMIERHHAIFAQTVLKTKEDTNCRWALALAWSLNAKNFLEMFGGYSAYQLAIGQNPPLPNAIDNTLLYLL